MTIYDLLEHVVLGLRLGAWEKYVMIPQTETAKVSM